MSYFKGNPFGYRILQRQFWRDSKYYVEYYTEPMFTTFMVFDHYQN